MKILALSILAMWLSATTALADLTTFTPSSAGVNYAVNDSGFFVSNAPITGSLASAGINVWTPDKFWLSARGPGYSDAGIVLFFDGGLRLGQLQDVTVATDNPAAMNINLWLDTGGDGKLFAFTGTHFDGLNGDSYGSFGNTVSLTPASSPAFFTGPAGAHSATLADLQAAYPDADVAIWAGITNGGGWANISSIDVSTTGAVPEPSSIVMMATMLGMAGFGWRRRFRRRDERRVEHP